VLKDVSVDLDLLTEHRVLRDHLLGVVPDESGLVAVRSGPDDLTALLLGREGREADAGREGALAILAAVE